MSRFIAGLTLFSMVAFGTFANAETLKYSYCKPEKTCWPDNEAWQQLNQAVHGRLVKLNQPLTICAEDLQSKACQTLLTNYKNPFYLQASPSATQQTGWYNAWESQPSTYAIEAKTAQDISAGIKFAKKHHLKLVVKGTGHDYLGRSNAPDSLLIWTHRMHAVDFVPNFTPAGCPKHTKSMPAARVEAGASWEAVYEQIAVENNRFVLGGGCLSVGAAGGFLQGGGYGSWSKKFGTGAANLLEAEIITADGQILVANACQNTDLFWALKGGGGGTFGVVSRVVLQTHPMPEKLGILVGSLIAKDDQTFKTLIKKFLKFYRDEMSNEFWGEQVSIEPNNELRLSLSFVDLKTPQVQSMWDTFIKDLEALGVTSKNFKIISFTGKEFWDIRYREKNLPNSYYMDDLGFYWWRANAAEVSLYIDYYLSRYIHKALLTDKYLDAFSEALFKGSRLNPHLVLHFNKGQHHASKAAIEKGRLTSMNPKMLDAEALLIIAAGQQFAFPQIPEKAPDVKTAQAGYESAIKALSLIDNLYPKLGTYPNEANYFEANWQEVFWGKNYPKLLAIKKKYDPDNLFTCHHCVGSEMLSQTHDHSTRKN